MRKRIQIHQILVAICLLLGLFTLVSAQKTPACVAEIEKVLFEAQNLENYKDLSSAKADECVKQNPRSVEALIVRSKLLALKGDFDLALADANKAIELSPQSSDAFYARGFAYEEKFRSKYDSLIQPLAIADYEKALKLNPKNGLALLDKTYLRKIVSYIDFSLILSDYDLAIQYLKAGGNSADLARAYGLRGLAYADEFIYDKAISDYTTALKLRPNYITIFNRRGDAYQSDKKLDAAIADYSEYLKVKPSARIFNERAGIYEEKGEISKAVADYRAALALEPNNNTAKTRLAKLGVKP